MLLSVIIPVHNEEQRLEPAVQEVLAWLDEQPFNSEVLIVENGSQDQTLPKARLLAALYPSLEVISIPTRGKGEAVRYGMLAARGDYRYMADCDFSTPASYIGEFLYEADVLKADIVIGSRAVREAIILGEPAYRKITGRVFNALIRAVLPELAAIRDTQCGFKLFSSRAANDLFGRSTLGSMAFDVEVLFLAMKLGYSIRELPVLWTFDPDSRVRLISDSRRMFQDLLYIRRAWATGVYFSWEAAV